MAHATLHPAKRVAGEHGLPTEVPAGCVHKVNLEGSGLYREDEARNKASDLWQMYMVYLDGNS